MNAISKTLLIAVSVIGVGILTPYLVYKDASNISKEEAQMLKKEANIFEHPVAFIQITRLVVREKKNDMAFVDAYTFFGLKYAIIELKFERRSKYPSTITVQCPSGIRFGINPVCREQATNEKH